MEAFIIVLIVVCGGIVVATLKSGSGKSYPGWVSAAQRLGLRFEHANSVNGPVISGKRRGLWVRIDTFSKGGEENDDHTRYRVSFGQSLDLGLRIVKQDAIGPMIRRFGSQDIEVGDPEFDREVKVKAKNPDKVIQYLTPTRRLGILRFLSLHPNSMIGDVAIECEAREVTGSSDCIVQTIQHMTALAEQLAVGGSTEEGRLAGVMVSPGTGVGDHSLVIKELPQQVPIFRQPIGAARHIELENDKKTAVNPETCAVGDEGTSLGPNESVPPVSEETEVAAVVQVLFTPGNSPSQTSELFACRYKNEQIHWSGTLTSVRSFRFDLIFGNEPGTRAEFELVSAGDPRAAGRAIKAVAGFPVDVEEVLRGLVECRVAFSGVLSNCDAFMKTLFVQNGRIDEADA